MVMFGLLKGLASKEPVVNGCMSHTVGQMISAWFLFFSVHQPIRNQYSPIILSLGFTHHFEA